MYMCNVFNNIGWDKVAKLVEALLKTDGIAISNRQANAIVELWKGLDEYDKCPLTYPVIPKRPPTGRFARTRNEKAGHISLTAMKR